MKHRCIICLILVSQGKSLFTENKSLFPFYLLLSLIPLQPSISKYKLTVNIFKLATQLQGMGTRNRVEVVRAACCRHYVNHPSAA